MQLIRRTFEIMTGLLIVWLSIPVVNNMFLAKRQSMNMSYDPLRIVNTHGNFGSITKQRTEIIFQGTYATDPMDPKAEWLDYEFKCKPGDLKRTPCIISPYHYRLDWLMWFAAFQNYQYNPWLVHIAMKMLVNDELFMTLISHNPFQDKDPPRYVRAEHFVYHFTKIGSKQAKKGEWYTKKYKGSYLPPVNFKVLVDGIKQLGWPIPGYPKAYYPPDKSSAEKRSSN